MIHIIIVEDDQQASKELKEYIESYCQQHDESVDITIFQDGLSFIANYEPKYDAVFMDIEMPKVDGIEAAEALRKVDQKVHLVFVTNIAKYAIKGYEFEALGYLMKPINYFALSMLLGKILMRKRSGTQDEILLSIDGAKVRFSTDEIFYIEVLDHWLIYHTSRGEMKELGKMADLEKELAQHHFYRCHKSYLIHLKYVGEIRPQSVIVHGDEIPIGRSKKKELFDVFCKYLRVEK